MKTNIGKKSWLSFIIAASLSTTSVFAAEDTTGNTVKWTYTGATGAAHWADLNADFALCGSGKAQSPINIQGSVKNIPNLLNINYVAAPLVVVEDGPTTLTLGKTRTVFNTGHGVQVNFSGQQEQINLDGTVYYLTQFHIHTPSETTLQGQAFPAEIHFVNQGPNGSAAVIAVFVKVGKPNATLQEVIDHLPQQKGVSETIANIKINPANLIPSRQNYYSFTGSLTTPPCTEGLHWMVMSNPITASQAQIKALEAAAGEPNARPVQPLNGRSITASVQKM